VQQQVAVVQVQLVVLQFLHLLQEMVEQELHLQLQILQ
jgi:hypothetical protein